MTKKATPCGMAPKNVCRNNYKISSNRATGAMLKSEIIPS